MTICFPRSFNSWNDVTIIPSLLVSRFCTLPEVKFHGEEKSISNIYIFLLYLSRQYIVEILSSK